MTVSSARLNNNPDNAEKRMRNSPHCIAWLGLSWYFDCDGKDGIDVLCLDGTSPDKSNAFTELKSSTGVKGVRDAKAVDNISRT